jgi:predicted HAD superfamily phosphohydrolase
MLSSKLISDDLAKELKLAEAISGNEQYEKFDGIFSRLSDLQIKGIVADLNADSSRYSTVFKNQFGKYMFWRHP